MKRLVLLVFLYFAFGSSASPVSHRWSITPDASGRMHLVDTNPVDVPVPHFDAENDVVILLYTRDNPTVGQRLYRNADSIRSSNFNAGHQTRVTIHGWLGSLNDAVNIDVTAAYLQHGYYNMIVIDWNAGASTSNYIEARDRVGEVGAFTARFLDFCYENGFIQFYNLHVIGHSLGAHVAGHTGKAVSHGRIQVIVGVDPAGPLFYYDTPSQRLASTDGIYVETIHTNRGLQGIWEPIGQASFFPNYGQSQPGCGLDLLGSCAHHRVVQVFKESINSVFTAQECSSINDIDNFYCTPTGRYAQLGGPYGNVGLNGVYYLTTNDDAPFSRG